MSNYNYTLTHTGTGYALPLPADARVTNATLAPDVELDRAVDSDVWEVYGDLKAKPAPLELTFTLLGVNEDDARLRASEIYDAAFSSNRLVRGANWHRDIHALAGIALQPTDSPDVWTARLTLYPKGPRWVSNFGQKGVM